MKYQVVCYSYVTYTRGFDTLEEARNFAKEMDGEDLTREDELDPQDKYPITEVQLLDEDGNQLRV